MTSSPPYASLRSAVAYVSELHGSIRRPITEIVVLGAVSGVVEALALVTFVRAAVAITTDDVGDPSIAGITIELTPGALLLIAIVASIVAAMLHVLLARKSVIIGEAVALSSRRRLIDGFLGAQWAFASRYREGRLQQAVSSLTESTSRATTHLAVGLSSIVIIIALGTAAIVASPLISLMMMAVPVICFLAARPHLRKLRANSQKNIRQSMSLSEATASTARLALEYRVTGTQTEQAERLGSIAADHAANVARTRTAGFTMSFLFKDIALIALIAVVGGLYLVTDLRDAAITASVLLVIRMLGYAQQAFRLVQEGAEELATISALREAVEDLEQHREVDGEASVVSVDTIVFDEVTYDYGTDRPALAGVSLTIEPNTTIGLVGPSGAGKSTIAELLLGVRHPSSGTVTVAGHQITDIRRKDWAKLTAFVPQDEQLAEVSIRENIRFLREWITDETVVGAAGEAHVHNEIQALPGGYDYEIGARSTGLSGGQRQRIAIARALAGRPQLLVLDEPTSALDAHTEELICQTLEELHGQITIVVIAHRAATIRACDVVIHLRDGRIERVVEGPRRARTA